MAIINKYKGKNPQIKLIKDEYWDFVLSSDITPQLNNHSLTEKCLISYVDFSDNNCISSDNKFYSLPKYVWPNAKNDGAELDDIGLTGIDNGLIHYKKDRISNEEFLNILTNSKLTLEKDDFRFFLSPITGNTLEFSYPYNITKNNEQFLELKGGFLQGFFKLFGFNYETLPSNIENGWCFEFVLRKKDYNTEFNILNETYPNNKGIFFYIGSRAENKFWEYYNVESNLFEENKRRYYNKDGYFAKTYPLSDSNVINADYFGEELEDDMVITDKNYLEDFDYINDKKCCDLLNNYSSTIIWETCCNKDKICKPPMNLEYFLNEYGYSNSNICPVNCNNDNICNDNSSCENKCDDSYFIDEYIIDNSPFTDVYLAENDYFKPEIMLSEDVLTTTKDGYEITKNGYYEIKSDNKFLFFNHTETGFTVNNWTNEPFITFTGISSSFNPNYFLLMNSTKTGYTTNTINEYISQFTNKYDVIKDIVYNAFALKISDDNSIGYKYLIRDCDSEQGYSIIEEYSKPNIIPIDEWAVINIKIKMLNPNYDLCYVFTGKRRMKIYFYVNGNLIFISKELPEFNFKELNDTFDKQEGVPFNISIGGGSQGLCETIWLNYYDLPQNILPIEKNFAGTFIGDIKSFKFYNCLLNYQEIKNNYNYEKNK